MNLNKAMIIGNLTRDPELKNTPSGIPVATFSVATNERWTDKDGQTKEKVEFHNVVIWRRLGEVAGQYLRKGSKVYLEGKMMTRDWTAQDGSKRFRTEIVVSNMIMLDSKPAQAGQQAYQEPAYVQQSGQEDIMNMQPEDEIQVANIPF